MMSGFLLRASFKRRFLSRFKHFTSLLQQNQLTKEELISLMKNSDEYKDIDLMNNFIKKYDLLFTKNHTKNRLQELSKIGDRGTLNSNFFWYGKNFGFLNNITIKSHLKVGYHPKIWLSGEKPSNEYWKDIESNVTVIDVSEYFNVEEFLSFGGNIRIASDLWSFHFLHAYVMAQKRNRLYLELVLSNLLLIQKFFLTQFLI